MNEQDKMQLGDEDLIYADSEPDVQMLRNAYNSTLTEISSYLQDCNTAYNERRNIWPGKSNDLRKHGAAASPWEGSSDQEVNIIGERIDTYSALFNVALERSHIKAFPSSMTAMAHAGMVSAFVKWMQASYIPGFKYQMELAGNHLLEKGLMISYVGWERESRTYLESVSIDQLSQQSPDLVDLIMEGSNDDSLVSLLQSSFPKLTTKRAKKVISDLRKIGEASIPTSRQSVDRPIVRTCAPDGEVFFPSYVMDPQRAPYMFYRTFMTAQEIEKKVVSDGWDRDWADKMIKDFRGYDSQRLISESRRYNQRQIITDDQDLIMIVYAYQRLIDDDDGSEGIYCTAFNPSTDGYGSHELMNGLRDYPFIVTRLHHAEKRLYDTRTFSDSLRGAQFAVKDEIDSRINRASLATLPPLMHPQGRPPGVWEPGGRLAYRRLGEIQFGPIPPFDQGSMEIEMSMRKMADRAVGLDPLDPSSPARQQFFIGKFLDHAGACLEEAFKMFQRFGPEEVFFQVNGSPDGQTMGKGDPDDEFSIIVAYDSRHNDPEVAEVQMKRIEGLLALDRNGKINIDKLIEFEAMSISPILANQILMTDTGASAQLTSNVTQDLSKIFSGIECGARPGGAEAAMQIIQNYVAQPDVMNRAKNDEAFAARLQKYHDQYQFIVTQQQNATIGKLGTDPASMGQTDTQDNSQNT